MSETLFYSFYTPLVVRLTYCLIIFYFKFQVSLILLFILFAFASPNDTRYLWMGWAVAAIAFALVLITDFMFLNERDFIFDPNMNTWAFKSGLAT